MRGVEDTVRLPECLAVRNGHGLAAEGRGPQTAWEIRALKELEGPELVQRASKARDERVGAVCAHRCAKAPALVSPGRQERRVGAARAGNRRLQDPAP